MERIGKFILFILPFLGFLAFLPWVNRVEPFILGIPFFMFWIALWVVLTSAILALSYRLFYDSDEQEGEHE